MGIINHKLWKLMFLPINRLTEPVRDLRSPVFCPKQGQLWGQISELLRDLSSQVLKTFKDGNSFGQPAPILVGLHGEKTFLYIQSRTLISIPVHCLLPSHHPPLWRDYVISLSKGKFISPWPSWGTYAKLTLLCYCLSYAGGRFGERRVPKTGCSIQMWSSKCWAEKSNHVPVWLPVLLLIQLKILLASLAARAHHWWDPLVM